MKIGIWNLKFRYFFHNFSSRRTGNFDCGVSCVGSFLRQDDKIPEPETRNLKPETSNLKLKLKPETSNLKPET